MEPRVLKSAKFKTDADRATLHELACLHAEKQYKLYGYVAPAWLIAWGDRVALIETAWASPEEKFRTVHAISLLVRETGANAYAGISEAWVMSSESMPPELAEMLIEYSDQHGMEGIPDEYKDDVVMINSFGRDGDWSMTNYKVTIRRPGQGLSFLGPRVDKPTDDLELSGPMWNLFREQE